MEIFINLKKGFFFYSLYTEEVYLPTIDKKDDDKIENNIIRNIY